MRYTDKTGLDVFVGDSVALEITPILRVKGYITELEANEATIAVSSIDGPVAMRLTGGFMGFKPGERVGFNTITLI